MPSFCPTCGAELPQVGPCPCEGAEPAKPEAPSSEPPGAAPPVIIPLGGSAGGSSDVQ